MPATPIPTAARWLGFAGLLPQINVVLVEAIGNPESFYTAQATGFAYAALIASFLGGAWWGLAARSESAPAWTYGVAVVPSLAALASCIPWLVGSPWPGPSLIALGLGILASLPVDVAFARAGLAPAWWLRLRIPLSIGLGVLTILAGVLAQHAIA